MLESKTAQARFGSLLTPWRRLHLTLSKSTRSQECAGFTGEQRTLAAGASSFGMSGVNAHGLFTAPEQPSGAPAVAQLQWHAARHWITPISVAMLQQYLHGSSTDTCRRAIAGFFASKVGSFSCATVRHMQIATLGVAWLQ